MLSRACFISPASIIHTLLALASYLYTFHKTKTPRETIQSNKLFTPKYEVHATSSSRRPGEPNWNETFKNVDCTTSFS